MGYLVALELGFLFEGPWSERFFRHGAPHEATAHRPTMSLSGDVRSRVLRLLSGRLGANRIANGTFGSASVVAEARPIFGKRFGESKSQAFFAIQVWLVLGPASTFGRTRRSGLGRGGARYHTGGSNGPNRCPGVRTVGGFP